MKTLRGNDFLIFAALLFMCVAQIQSAAVKNNTAVSTKGKGKAEEPNDLDLSGVKKFLDMVPILGPMVENFLDSLANMYHKLDNMSLGLLTRMLNGLLPCTMFVNEVRCTADSEMGGAFGMIEKIVNMIPSPILPLPVKWVVKVILKVVVNPLVVTISTRVL